MVYLFWILGIAASLAICLTAGFSGILFVGLFLLFAVLGFFAAFLIYILVLWAISLFIDCEKPDMKVHPPLRFFIRQTVQLVLFVGGVRVHAEGLDKVPEGTFLLVGNHRSGFDPFVALWALRKHTLNFVSKPENFKVPIAAPFLRRTGFLSIDRDDDRQALRTIRTAAEYMEQGVASFAIYPEGTRSQTSEMLPFRCGCFKAAQRAQVPVVVASIQGSEKITKHGPFFPTPVTFRICGVIDKETVRAKKATELGDIVRDMLEASLAQS